MSMVILFEILIQILSTSCNLNVDVFCVGYFYNLFFE